MSSIFDADTILSENDQWRKLEEEWKTVDLVDIEDETPHLKPVFSTLDLNGTTFDSSFLFKKVRRKVGRQISKISTASIEYEEFLSNIRDDSKNESTKQFYFINGQLTSAASIEELCDKIDDIFKSIDELSIATSTVRLSAKKKKVPDVVQCSISATDLSFDDTASQKEVTLSSEIDRQLEEAFEEAFEQINSTIATVEGDKSHIDSVTTLVRKFSSVMSSPMIKCNPRRRRECCDKFKELTDFWKNRDC
ncbi:uncharacterized protein LOC120624484 [Pararge aegeria]|uniref:Jg20180 protein n=2 Tax=Pararge aegeria TaxID=116150 RepID=A0A8S4RZ84_9NEOP|nr:uncharacterized protein LOC120624484 [Pararge aegeria]CAH2244236.1 jg20180 [Pararge aegeria aegeria]